MLLLAVLLKFRQTLFENIKYIFIYILNIYNDLYGCLTTVANLVLICIHNGGGFYIQKREAFGKCSN